MQCTEGFSRRFKIISQHTRYGTRFHHSDFRYFNSPFGVLFNFPSRYLFAIGLFVIFSVGW